ncbi:Uncharacterized protein SCF082_LOCUS20915, partial [Durusdinium trenchii]
DTQSECQSQSLLGICEWPKLCECPTEYFGEECEEERTQFEPQNDTCVELASQPWVCKGLVIASSREDAQTLCSDKQDCTTWKELKDTVGQLRAIDLGSIVLHGIAVLATSLCFLVALERYQINQIRWFEEGFLHGSARLESQEDGWHVAATGGCGHLRFLDRLDRTVDLEGTEPRLSTVPLPLHFRDPKRTA